QCANLRKSQGRQTFWCVPSSDQQELFRRASSSTLAIKIKIPKNGAKSGKAWRGLPRDPVIRAALIVFLVAAVGLGGSFSYFYIKYDRIIQQRFSTPVFTNSAKIYAIPRVIRDGDKASAKEIASALARAGYSEKEGQSARAKAEAISF